MSLILIRRFLFRRAGARDGSVHEKTDRLGHGAALRIRYANSKRRKAAGGGGEGRGRSGNLDATSQGLGHLVRRAARVPAE